MKKAVFFLAIVLLSSSYLKAQPYITINNTTGCNLYVVTRVTGAGCTPNYLYTNTSFPASTTIVVDAKTLCGSCNTSGFAWIVGRVKDICGADMGVGDNSFGCTTLPATAGPITITCGGSTCGGAANAVFTPLTGGDAILDINP